ncbi:hypothetical protein F7Q99_00615 [Streptomyces kaniharaensis]|uniref:Uncharacterized protein n=1 Tax=Streptomyces kaniharaensis TaxID=212423 RepID=A0A6N7KK61_9ACTN|nr:hypothetical protein [Streptomyces kaniharaensis]MQS10818.1 hypothetical protein [Streptomyces kaniharaensis]
MSKKAPGAPPPFVLWREVLAAYAMPAVTAGIGGLATRQPQLAIAAVTTIAGTSALVAALLGARLRHRPAHAWTARAPRALSAMVIALGAATAALAVGLAGAHWLTRVPALAGSTWPGRLPVDLPVSSAIAAALITWRWRASRPPRHPQHRITSRPERQTS